MALDGDGKGSGGRRGEEFSTRQADATQTPANDQPPASDIFRRSYPLPTTTTTETNNTIAEMTTAQPPAAAPGKFDPNKAQNHQDVCAPRPSLYGY